MATFLTPVPYSLPRFACGIFVADVNHDGIPDLVVGCSEFDEAAGGAISVLYGNGNGTFQAAINSLLGTDAMTIVAGDYTGDGGIDVAFTEDLSTDVAISDGGGHFAQAAVYHAKQGPNQVFAGNFLAAGAVDPVSVGGGSLEIFPSAGHGKFGPPAITNVQYSFPAIAAEGDFPDIVAVGSHGTLGGTPNGLQVFFGQNGTNLQPGPAYERLRFNVTPMTAGDLNNDGIIDLVTVCDVPTSSYVVAVGTGSGHFQIGSPISPGVSPSAAAIGDFNSNGKPDLVLAGSGLWILLGNGDGTFQTPVAIPLPLAGLVAVAASDLNGDGKLDVMARGNEPSEACVILGNGDGTFQPAACYATGSFPGALAVADYNGDGELDIATASYNGDAVSILLNNGDGTFQPAVSFAVANFQPGSPPRISTATASRGS